jgi:DNA-binding response OmpR family regulator
MGTMERALVLDDNLSNLKLLAVALKSKYPHCRLDEARNIAKARALYAEHQHPILLFDVQLPDGDGLDLAAEIRAQSATVKIIMLSAQDDNEHLSRACQAGVSAYIVKPFNVREVLTLLGFVEAMPDTLKPPMLVLGQGRVGVTQFRCD